MADVNEGETPDPVICLFCEKEISVGDTFVDVQKNLGIRESGGYVKGSTCWDTETNYVHLKHILFTKENM